eukprot:TRINITY_DN4623_c0_g1_i1.p1 TRINITY_DN4623_c0_g1~~TRINITY_DN4623_c0_g1_i1.p1  ORF type:complete len:1162 (+),score=193.23 TRINITY_DN4623_c0_g1_i1:169-3654(+)
MVDHELGVSFKEGEEEPEDDDDEAFEVSSVSGNESEEEVNLMALAEEINTESFGPLRLERKTVVEMRNVWNAYCQSHDTIEAAADLLYEAIFESSPAIQQVFTTPKAVQAMRFIDAFDSYLACLDKPKQLKQMVELLAYRHINIDVTVTTAEIFRDAIMDLLVEVVHDFDMSARIGWLAFLGWIGGAHIYIKTTYQERLSTLEDCWQKANKTDGTADAKASGHAKQSQNYAPKPQKTLDDDEDDDAVETSSSFEEEDARGADAEWESETENVGEEKKSCCCCFGRTRHATGDGASAENVTRTTSSKSTGSENTKSAVAFVPSNFKEMFEFNIQVMGLRSNAWLEEILYSFDAIVTHIGNPKRLEEELDVLTLRIAKVAWEDVNLNQFKSVMLASLRSLLPKEWDTHHEVAWNWLWDVVDQLLSKNLGKPYEWENSLYYFLQAIGEDTGYQLRSTIYDRFFIAAPLGQDYFKQSDTRLHFIMQRVFNFSMDIFADPWQVVDDISALGLRHVGYGVPTELFGPFVTAVLEVMLPAAGTSSAKEALRWSLALIAQQLVRTISEGSTLVMKAVNTNSGGQLVKAVNLAPRGKRAEWLLNVQVGTHSISPLFWAIQSGSLDAARSIIEDLLVIRADRERYYFGADDLFGRHQDIVGILCHEAPSILPTLLDGLCWRSTRTQAGTRRANYYVKHLIINKDGQPAEFLRELCKIKDPKLMCHPVVVTVSDKLWSGLVQRQFLLSRLWFIASLITLMLSQSILPKIPALASITAVRWIILFGRCSIYCGTLVRLIIRHAAQTFAAIRHRKFRTYWHVILVPEYLHDLFQGGSLILMMMLLLMCFNEPMLHCAVSSPDTFPTDHCGDDNGTIESTRRLYSVWGMLSMGLHWGLMLDLSVFSTGLSAFFLVLTQVLGIIGPFVIALVFELLMFGTAVTLLQTNYFEMRDIPNSVLALFAMVVMLFEDDYRSVYDEPALLIVVFVFFLSVLIVLMNILIAQLNSSYVFIYQDMIGFARIRRALVIVETLSTLEASKWERFVSSLNFDKPLEFNEGDVGMAGGLQICEPASEHVVLKETIARFGGLCSEDMQWPDEGRQEEDKLIKVQELADEALLQATKQAKLRRRKMLAGTDDDGGDHGDPQGYRHSSFVRPPIDVDDEDDAGLSFAGGDD